MMTTKIKSHCASWRAHKMKTNLATKELLMMQAVARRTLFRKYRLKISPAVKLTSRSIGSHSIRPKVRVPLITPSSFSRTKIIHRIDYTITSMCWASESSQFTLISSPLSNKMKLREAIIRKRGSRIFSGHRKQTCLSCSLQSLITRWMSTNSTAWLIWRRTMWLCSTRTYSSSWT